MIKQISILSCLCVVLITISGASLYAEKKKKPEAPDDRDYCVSCHETQQKQNLRRPVAEWKKSVHATAGKKCSACHGGDASVNDKVKAKSKLADFVGKPDRKALSEFCGRTGCHVLALEQFKRGAHYQSVQKTGEPGCSSCHGVHNIRRSSIDVISVESCTACHPADYSREIVSTITRIDKNFSAIDRNISFISEKQGEVKKLRDRVNVARHLFHQFVHVFSRQDMESTSKILEMELQGLDSETRFKVASIRRLDMLYIAMLIFGLAVVIGISTYSIIMYGKRRKG